MSNERPLFLVTNDDGIDAVGLHFLEQTAATLGDVLTVAPATEASAASHAISLRRPVTARTRGTNRWAVEGTPADCVYLALAHLAKRRPTLVLSGINPGPNLGFDTMYSGTVAAALEGAIHGIPGVAFSIYPHDVSEHGPFGEPITTILRMVLAQGLPAGAALSVNMPSLPRQGRWQYRLAVTGGHRYSMKATPATDSDDAEAGQSFWLGGRDRLPDGQPGTDTWTLNQGFVALTLLRPNLTDESRQTGLSAWPLFTAL